MAERMADDPGETRPITEELIAEMRALVARYPQARSAMLPCLHLVQQAQGRITVDGVLAVAEVLDVKPDEVESIVTFYSMYSNEPRGRYVVKVCTSIACYLRGCDALLSHLESRLGVARGETTPDGQFTLETIECLAACGGAPVAQVNGEFVEQVTPEHADELLARLAKDESIADLAVRWRENDKGGFVAIPAPVTAGSTASTSNPPETGVRLEIAPVEMRLSPNGAAKKGGATVNTTGPQTNDKGTNDKGTNDKGTNDKGTSA